MRKKIRILNRTILKQLSLLCLIIAMAAIYKPVKAQNTHPSIGGYNVYYGHLHNHSDASDGAGTPSSQYLYAKNTAQFDFFSLADHSNDIHFTPSKWNEIKSAANQYNQDGVFTTFYGFEWSSSNYYGHIAVINTDDYCSTTSPTNTFNGLISWLSSRPNGVAFFNHPGRENDNNLEFSTGQAGEHFSSTPSNQIVGMELWNKNKNFTEYYYSNGFFTCDNKGYFDEALSKGWKIGATGAGDNHSATWVNACQARMAVLANSLTRADILAAIQAKRFYSTLDKNLSLSFKIDGQEMGSNITNTGVYNIQILAADVDAEIFKEVIIYNKNHAEIQKWIINTTSVNINYSLPTYNGDYFYVKVKQQDNDEAISSPIWISGSDQNIAPVCSISSPNNGSSFTAPANITIDVTASDVDGSISKVQFYNGCDYLGEDLSFPYSFTWSGVSSGNYIIKVVAYDNVYEVSATNQLAITISNAAGAFSNSSSINTASDDAEENQAGDYVSLNSSDLELVYDNVSTRLNQKTGLRFTGLNIPQYANITNAYIQFTAADPTGNSPAINLKLRAEKADNSFTFSNTNGNISTRPTTTAFATWSSTATWTAEDQGIEQRTPQLAALINLSCHL